MARKNHEITEVKPLLNKQGNLAEPGWSRKMVQQYRRKDIKATPFRIKEWDYSAYLTYMQSTSREILGRMKLKLESRSLIWSGYINNLRYADDTTLMVEREEPLDESERGK